MRMKVHKIISTVLVVAMLLGNEVFAASRRETVWVGRDQAWHYRPNIARGRTSNSLHARAYSVYPNGGLDTFQKIDVRGYTGATPITRTVVLNEVNPNVSSIPIDPEFWKLNTVRFAFSGHDPEYAAYADVFYEAR